MEEYIKKIKADKEINKFIDKLTPEEIEMNICLFLEQEKANTICNKCKGKKECLSDVYHMQSRLIKNTSIVTREYFQCVYISQIESEDLEILYFPEQIDLESIDVSQERIEIINAIQEYKNSNGEKGIYLYGEFGTGKTYIMMNLAKYLAKKGKKVIFAYYPELVRKAKSSISDGTLEKLIVKLKNVDVLFLDDIGGELNTAFIRDEFLGPILQYRMTSHLPVFMTSNYGVGELKEHFKETKDESDPIKASRIIERIDFLMKPVLLKGRNYRRG